MAQFNLGNLCGTSASFNKLEQQFEKLKDQLINDVEAEASWEEKFFSKKK